MSDSPQIVAEQNIPLTDKRNFLAYEDFPSSPRLKRTEADSLNTRFSGDTSLFYDPRVRAVGVIATSRRFTAGYIGDEAVAARGTVVKLRDELIEENLIERQGDKSPLTKGGRPAKLFSPTLCFYGYLQENPEWTRAAKLHTVARRFNMTQSQLLDFMLDQVLGRFTK